MSKENDAADDIGNKGEIGAIQYCYDSIQSNYNKIIDKKKLKIEIK